MFSTDWVLLSPCLLGMLARDFFLERLTPPPSEAGVPILDLTINTALGYLAVLLFQYCQLLLARPALTTFSCPHFHYLKNLESPHHAKTRIQI